MDKSKKVMSLLLILCILTALCAVNVGAISYNNVDRYTQYQLSGFSCDPDVFFYDAGTVFGQMNGRTYTKVFYGGCIAFWAVFSDYSQPFLISPHSNSVIYEFGTGWYPNPGSATVNGTVFYNMANGGWPSWHTYTTDLPSYNFNFNLSGITSAQLQQITAWAINEFDIHFDEPDPPLPEPDPEYTPFEITGYIHNYKTWNDSLSWNSESSYSWSRPAIEVQLGTEPEYAVVYNKRSLFLSYVADGDYSDILTDLTVISGQIGVRVEKPNWGQSYQTSIDFYSPDHSLCNGYVLLTNGTDPYASGFQSFTVPSTWSSRFVVWQVPLSSYTSQFYFDYYFILPEDFPSTVGFSPTYIMFYFDSVYTYVSSSDGSTYTSLSYPVPNVDYWYWLTGLDIQYQKRSSSSTPSLPPSTVDPEYIDGQNQVDYGLEQEYQKTMEYYQGDSQLTSALSVFNLTNLAGSFQSLYNGLTYSGTDFTFKLPEASVPAIANVTTGFNLWQEQTIPLKEAIDNIPTPVLIIIRFIAWLGVGGAVFLTIKTLLSDLNGGNRDESSG